MAPLQAVHHPHFTTHRYWAMLHILVSVIWTIILVTMCAWGLSTWAFRSMYQYRPLAILISCSLMCRFFIHLCLVAYDNSPLASHAITGLILDKSLPWMMVTK